MSLEKTMIGCGVSAEMSLDGLALKLSVGSSSMYLTEDAFRNLIEYGMAAFKIEDFEDEDEDEDKTI